MSIKLEDILHPGRPTFRPTNSMKALTK